MLSSYVRVEFSHRSIGRCRHRPRLASRSKGYARSPRSRNHSEGRSGASVPRARRRARPVRSCVLHRVVCTLRTGAAPGICRARNGPAQAAARRLISALAMSLRVSSARFSSLMVAFSRSFPFRRLHDRSGRRLQLARRPEGQRRKANAKRQTPNAKRQTPNAKRQTPNAKRQTPNAKRQTPNAKRQTPNAKRQTPNAKRQTPNAKRQTPNAKRQTPNARLKARAAGREPRAARRRGSGSSLARRWRPDRRLRSGSSRYTPRRRTATLCIPGAGFCFLAFCPN